MVDPFGFPEINLAQEHRFLHVKRPPTNSRVNEVLLENGACTDQADLCFAIRKFVYGLEQRHAQSIFPIVKVPFSRGKGKGAILVFWHGLRFGDKLTRLTPFVKESRTRNVARIQHNFMKIKMEANIQYWAERAKNGAKSGNFTVNFSTFGTNLVTKRIKEEWKRCEFHRQF